MPETLAVPPSDRFIATRQGEILLVATTFASLLRELEDRNLDPRALVIEHTGAPRRARVF